MGNMCCTLDGSYIENSDPSILDKLNNCPELTDAQASAVEALLQSGKTKYGYVNTTIHPFRVFLFHDTVNRSRQMNFLPTTSSFLSDIPLLFLIFSPKTFWVFCFDFCFALFILAVFSITRAPSTWNDQTLRDLGMLPLYLTSAFYGNFDKVSNK